MQRSYRYALIGAAFVFLASCGGGSAPPDSSKSAMQSGRSAASRMGGLALPSGSRSAVLDPRLTRAKGQVDVWVSFTDPSVAAFQSSRMAALGAERQSRALAVTGRAHPLSATERVQRNELSAHRQALRAKQDTALAQLSSMGAKVLARVQVAHNAVAIKVDAASLQTIALLPGVAKVRPVIRYQLDLSETVPYVGAAAQAAGKDGTGVRVAVLDSGIDYTHRNLGGAGTAAAYDAAYADPTKRDGLFPTAKVIGGYDFVGETWPDTPEAPDDDPIDFQGHGTHVADIIAGLSVDGKHKGVAPGASLYALRVCSAIATACSGIALLQAMDFALDPNGDGDTSDAVDVINMSLGSNYGQIEDDLTLASANAVKLGVVVVASAGNGANKPYIAGSPANGVGVISVAQTEVPSAIAIPLQVNSPAAIAGIYANTQTMEFAPIGAGVTGDVARVGRGCPAGSIAPGSPEDAYLNSPTGKIALIDRGACSVSLKIDRAAKAGATGVLIGLVAGGDAISFSFGGGDKFVPSLVIQQALSTRIKAQLVAPGVVNVSISPAAGISLIGSMASSSSRGPAFSTQHIKPEIGAPGASVSAEVGTGTGETSFGGTSGAAPMVSGAAALLIQAFPEYSPERIKALLMNSAETVVYTNPALLPGQLAPITRVGAGELRVDRALALGAVAWDRDTRSAALSFGALEASGSTTVERKLRIENLSSNDKAFDVVPSFRYANDAASGAVRVIAPVRVHVGAHDSEDITVKLVIDATKLPSWTLNGGSQGGNGAALNGPEYDGYLTLTAGAEKLSVPWHVLPRKAAQNVASISDQSRKALSVRIANRGAEAGDYDLFSLTGTSRRAPRVDLPQPGDNFAVVDMRAVGVRYLPASEFGDDYLEFAINTQGRRAHPNYPAEFDIFIDTNGDGIDDFLLFNLENGGFGVTGQNVVALVNLATGAGGVIFFADADLNSGNMIFTVLMNNNNTSAADFPSIGVQPGQTIGFSALAVDNYFTGAVTDEITGMKFTPGKPRFNVGDLPFGRVAAHGRAKIDIAAARVPKNSSTESGVLVMHRRNAGAEANALRSDD